MSVIWHDLECGGYAEDLPLWRSLARELGDPILEVGAGAGRVALDLARNGHHVTALDLDAELLAALARRGDGLELITAVGDARAFALETRFALCLVPMQTIQLLGGRSGRAAFLGCARMHLRPGGMLAAALAEDLEPYEVVAGEPGPLPDMCERDGVVYSSFPTAIRADGDGFVLERRRETVRTDGSRSCAEHAIRLDLVSATEFELEAQDAGMAPAARARIPATDDYVGSEVVIVRA